MISIRLAVATLILAIARLGHALPPPPSTSVLTFCPRPTLSPVPADRVLSVDASFQDHLTTLQDAARNHGFRIVQTDGAATARKVVFLIAQLHASPSMPLWWTSIGSELTVVQRTMEELVIHLARVHQTRCIGSEGSSAAKFLASGVVHQRVFWRLELLDASAAVVQALKPHQSDIIDAIHESRDLLLEALHRETEALDGVGFAAVRLRDAGISLHRFGIEEPALLQDALRIETELHAARSDLERISPDLRPMFRDAIATLWLDEIEWWHGARIEPMTRAVKRIEAARTARRRQGDENAALALARYLVLVERIEQNLRRSAEIAALTEVFDAATADENEAFAALPPPPRSADALRRTIDTLERARRAVTLDAREKTAIARLTSTLQDPQHLGRCSLVMGRSHAAALWQRLRDTYAREDVGLVWIEPWPVANTTEEPGI